MLRILCMGDAVGEEGIRTLAGGRLLSRLRSELRADLVIVNAENSACVAKCFEAIAKIARAEGLDNGYRVINNCGEDGGQTVMHLHFHLLGGVKLGDKMI